MSLGGSEDDVLMRAAVDYAIANGVVVVAIAGNEGSAGMRFPGRYAPVISAGASGWVEVAVEFSADANRARRTRVLGLAVVKH